MNQRHRLVNAWFGRADRSYEVSVILNPETSPEGFNVCRYRWPVAGSWSLPSSGLFMSVVCGAGQLSVRLPGAYGPEVLTLKAGVHVYLPPASGTFEAKEGTEIVCVESPSKAQARGQDIRVRDEQFLSATADSEGMLRWLLTGQYLSRRVFLHHDETLVSRAGDPVSWFRTTMFDVQGLPVNAEGESVFKMSYDYRTEFNICYDVAGETRVRMAEHPYVDEGQVWGPWHSIDKETTYCVHEVAGGDEEERREDPDTGKSVCLRNRHEVYISGGYVTLFCLFDPAPTGSEQHRPGMYSTYGPLSEVLGTEVHQAYLARMARFDGMVDRLSMAKAKGKLLKQEGTLDWTLYTEGVRRQAEFEEKLHRALTETGRDAIVRPWMRRVAER